MSKIPKEKFVEAMQHKTIDINTLPQKMQQKIEQKGVDLNNDGKISGKQEMQKYFEALDQFDRNGDPNSIQTQKNGRTTTAGKYHAASQQAAYFDDDLGSRSTAREHMKKLEELPTHQAKVQYLAKAYHIPHEVADKVVQWTQLRPHPGNPNNPGHFIQALNQASAGTIKLQTRTLVGSLTQDAQHINLRLSDGSSISLKKYHTLMLDEKQTKHYVTSIVDNKGNAKLSGGLTPETDRKIRIFLKNIQAAIQKQEAIVARSTGSSKKLAQSKLDQLRELKSFGVRVFLHQEAEKRNIETCPNTKDVLRSYRFTNPHTDLTDVANMLELREDSRSYAIYSVVGSKEAYRGMGG